MRRSPFVFRRRSRCFAMLATLTLATAAAAAPPPSVEAMLDAEPALSKVSEHLLQARWRAARGLELAPAAEAPVRLEPFVTEERPRVDIRLRELTPALLAQMESAGLEVLVSSVRWARVDGRLPLDRLDEIAALPEVTAIHPFYGARLMTGSVTGQGDASMNADDARSMFGVDGSGVTVGLMSDSFHDTLGGTESGGSCACATPGSACANVVTGMDNQLSGDLPASIPILLDVSGGGVSDEGAALGELVADSAPGAAQMFRTAFVSETDFAAGIDGLVNCGADVIVDDVFYVTEPMFQDGPVAQAAQDAVDAGVAYFSAAGNQATFGIDDGFIDSGAADNAVRPPAGSPPTGEDLHDFDPGAGSDRFAAVTIPDGCGVTFILQWAEPWSGALGPGATSDLDLYICTAESAASCGPDFGGGALRSATAQGCGDAVPGPSGDPFEGIGITVSGGTATIFVAVEHLCGDETAPFRLATFPIGAGCGFPGAYNFEDGGAGENPIFVDAQIYGHAAAAGVVAVAAAFFATPSTVEPLSSLGGDVPIYFSPGGSPLGAQTGAPGSLMPTPPETRHKPDITAPDGTNTTFFGNDITFDADAFPNFFGTSASAPHAAAVAALMQEITNRGIGPLALSQILQQAADDIEGAGPDALSGAGFVDALGSVGTLEDPFGDGFLDELEFDLDGGAFAREGCTCQVKVRAKKITYRNGDFSNIDALGVEHIFADGFESGDTASWSSSIP